MRVNGDEGTPVPIPNTVVKLVYGDNTWLATAREDNSTPTSKAATKVAAFSFFCRDFAGYMSCVSNTSCLGGSLFCSGLLVDLNRAGDSLYQGGEFFAEIQRGVRRTTAVGKRVDTYGFYPLNSRLPLLLSLAQTRDRRPLRNGERQRIFSTAGEHSVLPFLYLFAVSDTLLLHMRLSLRRRDIPVSRELVTGAGGWGLSGKARAWT